MKTGRQAQATPSPQNPPLRNARTAWDLAVDRLIATALLLVLAKLAGSWLVVAVWDVPLHDRLIWGFVPYVGLETTPEMFRTVAAWSTAMVAIVAALSTLWSLLRRDRLADPRVAWASALALPMAALLAIFEWWRRADADHLLPTAWMIWTLAGLGASSVLFIGFFDLPWESPDSDAPTQPTARRAQPIPLPAANRRN